MTRRDDGDVTILTLSGRLMGGPDTEQFLKAMREVIDAKRTRVILDMGDVAWVNSSGLGALIAGWTLLQEKGGSLKLIRVSRRIEQILAVTKLDTVFELHPDEASARAGFGG
ncbi:MAG: STAS domain-containing protein [Candidatus Eisenbacteria bacterium]|nr:STAS domain-containing protein [Candidatus Eisenbacteria bacterium]